jgi:IS5 family transposase
MSLGLAGRQGNLLDDVDRFLDEALDATSIYVFFHRERDVLFPDEDFADLFDKRGRNSVPPSVVAVVMALQRLEGLSDREAVERYMFDARWRYAAGVGGYDTGGWTSFAHTVLVDMRERLRRSERPDRIFEVALDAARQAGLIGRRRVLDSTPLYDAVATMDTVTLIRSAIRGVLKVADGDLAVELRGVLASGDDYASPSKPQIDWDDAAAREELIDSRARDGMAVVMELSGRTLAPAVTEAACLLLAALGQDLEEREDGVFAIARRVAPDRVISTVDVETRHGHKTAAHSFDGYKASVAIDPDSELVTATAVTPGNVGDAGPAVELLADLLDQPAVAAEPVGSDKLAVAAEPVGTEPARPVVYGDAAYGTGDLHRLLEEAGVEDRLKTQSPSASAGRFTKDRFTIDLDSETVTCPAGVTVTIRRHKDGSGTASFNHACATCTLRASCTASPSGRIVGVNRNERELATARARQTDPAWRDDYRATRPKVERKLAHLMRRRHGGRRARVRGRIRVDADFRLLAAAHNLARLVLLGVHSTPTGWSVQ